MQINAVCYIEFPRKSEGSRGSPSTLPGITIKWRERVSASVLSKYYKTRVPPPPCPLYQPVRYFCPPADI